MHSIKPFMISAIAFCSLILGGLYYSDRRSQSAYATWAQEQNRVLNESQKAEEAERPKPPRPEKGQAQETKAAETSPASGEKETERTSASQTLKYTTSAGVNVSGSASQTGEKLGVLESGTVLEEARKEGEWIRFRYRGRDGYVSARYVSVEEE